MYVKLVIHGRGAQMPLFGDFPPAGGRGAANFMQEYFRKIFLFLAHEAERWKILGKMGVHGFAFPRGKGLRAPFLRKEKNEWKTIRMEDFYEKRQIIVHAACSVDGGNIIARNSMGSQ